MSNRRNQAAAALAAALIGCFSAAALGQESAASYPSKPIRIIVTQGVGGAVELHTRMFTTPLSAVLGKPIVLEARQNLNIGAPVVAKAPPDGYTWLAVAPDFTSAPSLERDLSVDVTKDFAPVTTFDQAAYFLLVSPGNPAKNVQQLVQQAKAEPGKLTFSGGLPGTGSHLVTASFLTAADIKATYVPYKGASNALTDLVAGRITASISGGNAMVYVKSGKLRVLGSTAAKRSPLSPEIPTIAEQGMPTFSTTNFRGIVATAGTPQPIIAKVAAEVAKIGKQPEVIKAVNADGSDLINMTPEEFKKFLAEDVARWRKVIEVNNIKMD